MPKEKANTKVVEIRQEGVEVHRISEDPEYRDEVRHRFLTDHFFAAKLLGFDKFVPELHQPAVDLYCAKNPKIPIEDQHPIKYRMHIDPRNTYKTTLGKVDNAQWVAAFPELITMLHEGATQPLAEAISASVGKFFWQRQGTAPTALQRAFPECVLQLKPEGKWNTPDHSPTEMDATSDYTSPKTSQSGWHPWKIDVDDMVDTTNSGIGVNPEVRQHVIDVYYTNKNLLRRGGYLTLRGTRYHPLDLHGDLLNKMDPSLWKVLVRCSLKVRNGNRLVPGEFPPRDEVELIFPQLLSYEELREKFYENYEVFQNQQQNDPMGGIVACFKEQSYVASLCAPERIPPMGDTVMCWRLPYSGKNYMAKYAEGAVARFYGNRVYILDCWQAIYTPSGLAEKIVRELKHHQTGVLMLEALPGTEYLDMHIRNEAVRRNVSLRIQWLDFEDDDAMRFARLRNLEPALEAGRISISTAATKASETRRQFLDFMLVIENGILDCISRLTSRLPLAVLRKEIADEEAELQRRRREDAMYNMVFGAGGVMAMQEMKDREKQAALATAQALNRVNEFGLPDLYGLDG